jgi:hypothetical protein
MDHTAFAAKRLILRRFMPNFRQLPWNHIIKIL